MEDFRVLADQLQDKISKAKMELETKLKAVSDAEEKLGKEKEEMAKRFPLKQEVVTLNIGGKKFSTYKSTLTKYPGSLLEAMFSGRHVLAQDEKGRVFVDRSPQMFEKILDFLRTGIIYRPENSYYEQLWSEELDYFGLKEIVERSAGYFSDSEILDSEMEIQLNDWIGGKSRRWKLIYRGSDVKDLNGSEFHHYCDGQPETIVLVMTEKGDVFGGYTFKAWQSHEPSTPQQQSSKRTEKSICFITDPNAFVFSMKGTVGKKRYPSSGIYSLAHEGPVWFSSGCIYQFFVDSNFSSSKSYFATPNLTLNTSSDVVPITTNLNYHYFNVHKMEVFIPNSNSAT